MAPPSSPPLSPEVGSEPPSSPPLLPTSAFSGLSGYGHGGGRKRQLCEYDSLSSDPLFSDDASGAEDVSEYGQPKRKRMVKGPWYVLGKKSDRGMPERMQTHTHASMKEKEPLRNFDSAVWMGSDGSEESADGHMMPAERREGPDRAESTAAVVHFTPEMVARRIVDDCVEHGREAVDLSGIALTQLSGSILTPLHQLIRHTHLDLTQPPSEDEFRTLTPEIKLFLSKNHLAFLPSELFHLENITVLSLRNNQLLDVPPSIARLHKLKELNIAGNSIRCLPWELLQLLDSRGDHKTISVRPNPFLEPTTISGPSLLAEVPVAHATGHEGLGRWGDPREYYHESRRMYSSQVQLDKRAELEVRLKLGRVLKTQYLQEASRADTEFPVGREELIYLASSSLQYFDVDGSPFAHVDTTRDMSAVIEEIGSDAPASTSAAPSLFELALRSVQEYFSLDEIPSTLPDRVAAALRRASNNVALDNQKCSTCHRLFINPRAEWVEYWFAGFPSQPELTQETVLPFARRACSWACAIPSEIGTFRC